MTVFAALAQDDLEAHPGGGASVVLSLRNTGAVVNEYRFEVLGPTSGWADVEPAVVRLFPGQEGTATVNWRPPRTPEAHAGPLPFGVRVIPTEQPETSVVEEGVLRVAPFYAMSAGLVPVTSRGRFFGSHRIVIDNASNAETSVALVALDADALLRFRMRPTAFRLKVGASRSIRMRVHPRRHKIKGHPESRNFQVFASQEGQDPQRVDGVYQQRALIAGWQFKVAVLAVVVLLAALLIPIFRTGKAHTLADASVPLPPTPVSAKVLSPTSLQLTWSAAGQNVFSGYEIHQVTLGPGRVVLSGQTVATAQADENAHTFTGLTTGKQYCYTIRSLDPKNTNDPASVFSPPVCATPSLPPPVTTPTTLPVVTPTTLPPPIVVKKAPPPAPGAPPAPVPVTVQVPDATDIRLTWTPQGKPTGFVVQDGVFLNGAYAGQQVAAPSATDTAHVFSGLTPGSQHCYVIWAVGSGGTSPHVGPLCATTLTVGSPNPPPVPINVKVAAVSNNGLQVTWDGSAIAPGITTATGYQIFENGSLAASQPVGATSDTFTGLVPGSHHCYDVRAVAGSLDSAFSPVVCGAVTAGVPTNTNLAQAGVFAMSSSVNPSEGDGRAVIGATVTFAVTVNIPVSGSTRTDLFVTLPAGLTFQSPLTSTTPVVNIGSITPGLTTDYGGGGGFAAAVAAASFEPFEAGQRLDVPLGDITNSSGNQTAAQTIVLDVPTVVLNADGVVDNTALPVSAQLQTYVNGAPVLSAAVTSTVTAANPMINATYVTNPLVPGGATLTLSLPVSGTVAYQVLVILLNPDVEACSPQDNPGGACIGANEAFFPSLSAGEPATQSTVNIDPTFPGGDGCAGVAIEWLSANITTGQSGIDAGQAFARSGPNDIPPLSSASPTDDAPGGTTGDYVVENACG